MTPQEFAEQAGRLFVLDGHRLAPTLYLDHPTLDGGLVELSGIPAGMLGEACQVIRDRLGSPCANAAIAGTAHVIHNLDDDDPQRLTPAIVVTWVNVLGLTIVIHPFEMACTGNGSDHDHELHWLPTPEGVAPILWDELDPEENFVPQSLRILIR